MDSLFDSRFEQRLSALMEAWHVPGCSIALTRTHGDGTANEEVIKCYGKASDTAAVEPDTQFAIASNTKLFTVLTLHQALASHGLDVDTKVVAILPEFELVDRYAQENATVRDLLTHRTGILGYNVMYGPASSDIPLLERLKHLQPNLTFRERFQYVNWAYSLVGIIIERLSGRPYEEAVMKTLVEPHGLQSTVFGRTDKMSLGYWPIIKSRGFEGLLSSRLEMPPDLHPAGGLVSCATDMIKWLKVFPHLPGYSQASTPCVVEPDFFQDRLEQPVTYGFGVFQARINNMKAYFHYGGVTGFRSIVVHYPDEHVGLAVFTNSDDEEEDLAWWINACMAEHLFGKVGAADIVKASIEKRRHDKDMSDRRVYSPIPGSGDGNVILGTFTSPGFLTFKLDHSSFLSDRPECGALPWLPHCYGHTRPIFTSMGKGGFEACFEWRAWDGGEIRYGWPFWVEKIDEDRFEAYGLSDLDSGQKHNGAVVTFERVEAEE